MLFHVRMDVSLPPGLSGEKLEALKAAERAQCQALQDSGVWRHIWRIAGHYANISLFDVESPQALHDILTGLPFFPYMSVTVTALCRHPSSIREDDR